MVSDIKTAIAWFELHFLRPMTGSERGKLVEQLRTTATPEEAARLSFEEAARMVA